PCRMLRRPLASAAGPPPDVYGLSLHDALPILRRSAKKPRAALLWRRLRALALLRFGVLLLRGCVIRSSALTESVGDWRLPGVSKDRKSTRLNSSHVKISYAVFCLKKQRTKPSE